MMTDVISILSNWLFSVWMVIESSSIWLLLGFFLAGAIKVFVPEGAIEKHLRGGGLPAVLKASAIGVPLPLCSCSVIPVATALRKQGASRGATASFLVSTPEIGVDSFLLSSALLSFPFACVRALAAFVSAFTIGVLVDLFPETESSTPEKKPHCAHEQSEKAEEPPKGVVRQILRAFHYGYGELLDDISRSLLVGILLAGLIAALVPVGFFAESGISGMKAMLLMLVISLPLYVCATSSTPMAGTLLAKGMDPGAVLVFLLVGPATNLATMMIVKKQLGTRALYFYLGGIGIVSMFFGYFASGFLLAGSFAPGMDVAHDHSGPLAKLAAAIFIVLLVFSLKRIGLFPKKASCC